MNSHSRAQEVERVAKMHQAALKTLGNHPAIRLAYEQGVRDAATFLKQGRQGQSGQGDEGFTFEEVRDAAELLVATGELSRIDADERARLLLSDRVAKKRESVHKRTPARERPKSN